MEDAEDEDIRLQRASAALLEDLRTLIPNLLWRPPRRDNGPRQIHRRVRERDMYRIVNLVHAQAGALLYARC